MGSPLVPDPPLPSALLSALSLVSALRTRQVNGAAAAGFALQSLCAACDAVAPALAPPGAPPDPLPGCWVAALVAQPLVAFGFLWHSGDPGTATLLLGVTVALAPAAAGLPAEGRALAARGAVAAAAGCVLALAALVADGLGALGAVLMGAGGLWPELRPWVLPPACLALQGALRGRRGDGGDWEGLGHTGRDWRDWEGLGGTGGGTGGTGGGNK